MPRTVKARGFLLSLAALLIATNLAVLLNIPILRQFSSFIFLTFIPGFLFLSILKLNKLGLVEKIVLSVGLSVAFLMLFGLLVNGSLLALGYTKPLSTISLLISFSTVTVILAVMAYIGNWDVTFSFPDLKLTTREKAFLVAPALFPPLSIVGMRIMNLTDNNVLLMLSLFLIPAYVIFISFAQRKVSERVYPAAIFFISISLLLMYSLRSNHIIGGDTHIEYLVFLTIFDNLHWSQLGFGPTDVFLSISLLPVIYQAFLNIDPEYLFKILFSLIFSISPLVVYLLARKYIGSFYAFLASAFFMSQIVFLWTPSYARVNIAVLFFSLAVWVMFHDGISDLGKRALFIVFAAGIIVSHYGVTYAAFFVLLFTWIGMQILPQIVSRKKKPDVRPPDNSVIEGDPPNFSSQGGPYRGSGAIAYGATALRPPQTQLKRGITLAIVALFLALLFIWYSQMTGQSFRFGVFFVYKTFANWEWFLTAGTGVVEQPVLAALGKTLAYTGVPQRIEFVFSWLTIIFISIGLLATIWRYKTMVSLPQAGQEKPNFLLKKFEAEYLVLVIGCFLLLVALFLLPHIGESYGAARVYFQMVPPLSIFFVIGGITVARYLKSPPYGVILVVLLPYFLCTSGIMTQLFSFPRAIVLNSEGPLYDSNSVSDAESYAAKWLKEHGKEGVGIYTGVWQGPRVLMSQGKILNAQVHLALDPDYEGEKKLLGYIYLRRVDLVDDALVAKYPDIFVGKNKIYATGGSTVYQ